MIPKLPFGKTGHDSTRVIFGAAALFRVDQDAAAVSADAHALSHRSSLWL